MNKPEHRWVHMRIVLVGVLIASILSSFSFRAPFLSFVDSCFVDDSGGPAKSALQLFDETKAGEEERSEKDIDDDFEERLLFGQPETSSLASAGVGHTVLPVGLTYSGGSKFGLRSQPIYLSHHSLLI